MICRNEQLENNGRKLVEFAKKSRVNLICFHQDNSMEKVLGLK